MALLIPASLVYIQEIHNSSPVSCQQVLESLKRNLICVCYVGIFKPGKYGIGYKVQMLSFFRQTQKAPCLPHILNPIMHLQNHNCFSRTCPRCKNLINPFTKTICSALLTKMRLVKFSYPLMRFGKIIYSNTLYYENAWLRPPQEIDEVAYSSAYAFSQNN